LLGVWGCLWFGWVFCLCFVFFSFVVFFFLVSLVTSPTPTRERFFFNDVRHVIPHVNSIQRRADRPPTPRSQESSVPEEPRQLSFIQRTLPPCPVLFFCFLCYVLRHSSFLSPNTQVFVPLSQAVSHPLGRLSFETGPY